MFCIGTGVCGVCGRDGFGVLGLRGVNGFADGFKTCVFLTVVPVAAALPLDVDDAAAAPGGVVSLSVALFGEVLLTGVTVVTGVASILFTCCADCCC